MTELLGKPVIAVAGVEETVAGADIVVDASRLAEEETLLRTEWLAPGALVMPYGAVRSTDPGLPLEASKFVVDDWEQAAASEFGQYYHVIAAGQLRREHVHAEIGEIVAGTAAGRERDDELIVFWHRGFAVSDIAIGALALRRAEQAGVGTEVVYARGLRPI